MEGARIRWRDVEIISTLTFFAEGGSDQCDSCSEKAEIFQAEGDFCLRCWQKETHPDV